MTQHFDLIVIGGGINGAGIAADAAGRGLNVLLLEAKDLACATSSASSKLIHGGLRYLEHYEFKLVSHALSEREVLLKLAPHLAFPMRFRLPHEPHLRPALMIRAGLFLYDNLGKRGTLPKSNSIKFGENSYLKSHITKGFEYSDCWVDDARLVVINAQEVIRKGGQVKTRTMVTGAKRDSDKWVVSAYNTLTNETLTYTASGIVNAAGPWVKEFFDNGLELKSPYGIRLIRGSHIVVPRVHDEPQAYILQNKDKRIVFVIPWLDEYSMIGTTDVEHIGDPLSAKASDAEIEYMLNAYNDYFKKQLSKEDIIWHFSGVRPLCDDESDSPQAITRDYTLSLQDEGGKLPLLSVFGGKLTTYRKLAEQAINDLTPFYTGIKSAWTSKNILPGGNFTGSRYSYAAALWQTYPWLGKDTAKRYAYTYGSNSEIILKDKSQLSDLGEHFGADLYEAELEYLIKHEWVTELDDAIWRRTKLGLKLSSEEQSKLNTWIIENR
ncbi:glycerol-3-phosphate dehydrogenase [Thorsellia anophelis]|uniref:Glycerol-3-phosphate dehydrogenase n=1 Tax=Thorsellia anophelis DSM 18579 TaxID=1123402 RepID=A0A1H9YWB8_9GAMM|nr:glycerol-3-phosphate dehydrogenase [Thorsellia anophelis]SES73439.1 homodimeric glycerol 3-phosphate dehydrogenase (quinone) [Thorsellia anophelis DSM 18579]